MEIFPKNHSCVKNDLHYTALSLHDAAKILGKSTVKLEGTRFFTREHTCCDNQIQPLYSHHNLL